jgi:hypothetical protein
MVYLPIEPTKIRANRVAAQDISALNKKPLASNQSLHRDLVDTNTHQTHPGVYPAFGRQIICSSNIGSRFKEKADILDEKSGLFLSNADLKNSIIVGDPFKPGASLFIDPGMNPFERCSNGLYAIKPVSIKVFDLPTVRNEWVAGKTDTEMKIPHAANISGDDPEAMHIRVSPGLKPIVRDVGGINSGRYVAAFHNAISYTFGVIFETVREIVGAAQPK